MDELDVNVANISVWRSVKENIYLANNVMVIMNDMITSMKGTKKHSRNAEHVQFCKNNQITTKKLNFIEFIQMLKILQVV